MDEGWSRWLFERYGFRFTNVYDADVRAGDLRDRYDVIVLPAERAGSLRDGFDVGTVPERYAGGLGDAGIRALDAFVRGGGTLVCLNQSSDLSHRRAAPPGQERRARPAVGTTSSPAARSSACASTPDTP